MVVFIGPTFKRKNPFGGKHGPKNRNCLFNMKFDM